MFIVALDLMLFYLGCYLRVINGRLRIFSIEVLMKLVVQR